MKYRHGFAFALAAVALFAAGCAANSSSAIPGVDSAQSARRSAAAVKAVATPETTFFYGKVKSITPATASSGTIVVTGIWSPTSGTTVTYNSSTLFDPLPNTAQLPVVGNIIIVTGPFTASNDLLTTMTAQNISTYATSPPPLSDNVFGMVTSVINANTFVIESTVDGVTYDSNVVLNNMPTHDGSAMGAVGDEVTVLTGYGTLDRALNADTVKIQAAPNAIPTPATGAYFGAWVNPTGGSGASPTTLAAETHALETSIPDGGKSYTMALHMHYFDWSPASPMPNASPNPLSGIGSDASVADDIASGRMPVISWRCGDLLTNIANGNDDSTVLAPAAAAIKALGRPVFLRFYWEFNLAAGTNGQSCFSTVAGAPTKPAQFVAAWEHIWTYFTVTAGVTNISWLWCPDGNNSSVKAGTLPSYFPNGYVNWIGFDAYDKSDEGFGNIAAPFITQVQTYPTPAASLPIMIAETGEEATPDPAATPLYTQANYFTDANTAISTGTLSGFTGVGFQQIKAFMYYDAPGATNANSGEPFGWSMTPGASFTAFGNMATNAYFNQLGP